jgi:hypothetical protein
MSTPTAHNGVCASHLSVTCTNAGRRGRALGRLVTCRVLLEIKLEWVTVMLLLTPKNRLL